MFFNEVGTKHSNLPDSEFTLAITDQNVATGLYELPKDLKIFRDRNPLHFRSDNTHSEETKLTSDSDRDLFATVKTPAVFMSAYKGITAPQQPIVQNILDGLEEQKTLYKEIFELLENNGVDLNTETDNGVRNYFLLRQVLQRNRNEKKVKARSVPDLDHKFVFFVATDPALQSKMTYIGSVLETYNTQIQS
jgi:hypothetical protein